MVIVSRYFGKRRSGQIFETGNRAVVWLSGIDDIDFLT